MPDPGRNQPAEPLFDSDGEMARRTGSFPWEGTSLGPAAAWPQSLRTAARIMLTSRFAMWMGWGRDLTFFYNDAYRVMTLGAKHPWALGRATREVWAEIWEQLEPRIAQVLAEGKATWDERLLLFLERSGYREESYHTFSYSPLAADGGETVGMLCVVSEETERVIGERRLGVLHELATQVSGADQMQQVLNALAGCLSKDARDLPFTLTYLLEQDGSPVLRAVTGLGSNHPAALGLGKADGALAGTWPLARVLESACPVVVELPATVAWPLGPWSEPPRHAVVVPIQRASHGQPWGLFMQDVLERQVAHVARLVDDLLDVSRIARGKIELDRRLVEACEVIVRAMEVSSPVLEQSHHRVELQVPRAGLLIHADLNRMAQVVSNLLTNAAKYSDPHSLIVVRAERVGSSIHISVKDQGSGIAPGMMGGIFDAFVQQPQTLDRARGGLGLGLTIVRSFVERHGGLVRAQSAGIGHGSEFIVELPAADGRVDSEPRPAEPLLERARSVRDKRILVVDDNEDAALILMQALEQLGYQVRVAHDGPSALEIGQAFQPDVALLDIGLPVMDGYELAQRLREARNGQAHLRLVAVTGYGQDKDRERSRRAGFDQHLVKPLDLAKIERAIEGTADAGARAVDGAGSG